MTKCRICGCTDLAEIMDLGNMALTGTFWKPGREVPKAPLKLMRCTGACGLVQLDKAPDLNLLYGENYGYRSGLNKSMVEHLRELVVQLIQSRDPRAGDLVLDIGSNDGTLLGFYPETTRRVGIDPSGAKFKQFYKPGIELIPDFFSNERVCELIGDQKARIVTSIAMFYDLEDPLEFMQQVASILDDDGVWLMEQSYLPAMMRANAFDTICHEHLEYYALKQIEFMAKRAGLAVVKVDETDTNGGSFVVWLMKDRPLRLPTNVQAMRDSEARYALHLPDNYQTFVYRSEEAMLTLERFLIDRKLEGKTVYGLGASTKGNVFLQMMAHSNLIQKIGDVNPDKWGCVTPGTGIPIISEDEALEDFPDYLMVLPWHFRESFMRNPKFRGRKLVFPLPQLEIVVP
jgi:NDP-4-keto-2,6-dideoxyhexose 3-C-methyltransferase